MLIIYLLNYNVSNIVKETNLLIKNNIGIERQNHTRDYHVICLHKQHDEVTYSSVFRCCGFCFIFGKQMQCAS